MIDTNCPWTPQEAREAALSFLEFDPYWLEEPIFPPEDYDSLARLQHEVGIPIASGENACTAFEFQKMFNAGAVSFAQPSVTKVGGVTELLKIQTLAEIHGVANSNRHEGQGIRDRRDASHGPAEKSISTKICVSEQR